MDLLRAEAPLKALYKDAFHIGAAVNPRTIESQRSLLAYHYNSITAENEMKFSSLHPQEDQYTFEDADVIAAFAREQGMALRGHTLVWHNQTPDWLFENEKGGLAEKEVLFARLRSHIQTVVGRYKDVVYCWDVVNEVISDDENDDNSFLRPSKWMDIAGESFIAKAFEFAHEADPQALLFYNDYNESNPHKRERIYRLVRSLLDQGIPIHGVGLQAHWNLYDPSLDEMRSAIERYAQLGLQIQLTELDVSVFRFEDRRKDLVRPTKEMLELQDERYESIFRLLLNYREHISAVTFWGAADDYTWLDDFPVRGRKNWPFLFDELQRPKEAYQRVAQLVTPK
ncbi:endo-1,4-beta-xylanase [Paenibacillus sp. Marseille-Q4541]|uniref:endo-1,4-beta-xylanase n=1 Tax=Paenibacillus sp. Marseille-Q4541 TaxID=2831522 RepID=UPI001BAB2F9A|nr:endo-1,4-beta-xylanase [Paenibacillus sp. Marseille-Q4541]